jgi:hypothetical protein
MRLSREYVKTGIRSIAEDLCTRQLGHRTELDAAEAERREIREKRFTSLDRTILKSVQSPADDRFLSVAFPIGGRQHGESDFTWNQRQHLIGRMTVLEDMGIARATGTGTWNVRSDLEAVLRAMQRAGDRQKVLAAHGLPLSDDRLQMNVIDFEKADAIEGRVLVHGEDEHSGRPYLMLEGIDARIYFIEYTREIEEARRRGHLRPNAFARFRRIMVAEKPAVQIQDLGDSEAILKQPGHFENKAQKLLKNGFLPSEEGWGGWLGRYQSSLHKAAMAVEYRERSRVELERPERVPDR